jgi:hypothetical protein
LALLAQLERPVLLASLVQQVPRVLSVFLAQLASLVFLARQVPQVSLVYPVLRVRPDQLGLPELLGLVERRVQLARQVPQG